MNEDYVLYNTLGSRIEISLSNPTTTKNLMKAIQSYADKHSGILLSMDLSTRLIHSDTDKSIIYTATGITAKEVEETIARSTVIKSTWKIANNPFYILSLLIISYYTKNNKIPEADAVTVYMSYLLYVASHKGSFKFLPNKAIMDYTLNNLSNRFFIKQCGTIQGMIENTTVEALHKRYSGEIRDPSDNNVKNVLSALETRVSSLLKNIADEFYMNHKNGKYMHHEDEDLSEDNFHLSDNISFKIERMVSHTMQSITSEGFDQNNIIKRAANLNAGTSANKIDSMLRTILNEDLISIPELISNIMTIFIYKGSIGNNIEDVKTMKFLSESLQIYKSNAQDGVTLKIKDTLARWINLTAEKYGRNFISKGKTSMDNYRRALYTCFVLKILECAKK